MSLWFVHVDQPYYPSAQVVEADDIDGAIIAAWEKSGSGPGYFEDRISFAVVPLDAVTFAGKQELVWSLVTGHDEDEFKFRDVIEGLDHTPIQRRALPPSIIDDLPPKVSRAGMLQTMWGYS